MAQLHVSYHLLAQRIKTRVWNLIRKSLTFWEILNSMFLHMFMRIYDWKLDHQFWFEKVQLIKRGKMVILSKVNQSQLLTKWTLGQQSIQCPYFHIFMINGGIKSRGSVELEITCQRSYWNFWKILTVPSTELWMIINFSFIIEKMQTLHFWKEDTKFFNFVLEG